VAVCPNRANIEFTVNPVQFKVQQVKKVDDEILVSNLKTVRIEQSVQVLNLADYCNECGNCATFCPTRGAPYKDKAKFHISRYSYDQSDVGFHFVSVDELLWKQGDKGAVLKRTERGLMFESLEIRARIDPVSYETEVLAIQTGSDSPVDTRALMEMVVLFQNVKKHCPVSLGL
jgi:putative selenate reductase